MDGGADASLLLPGVVPAPENLFAGPPSGLPSPPPPLSSESPPSSRFTPKKQKAAAVRRLKWSKKMVAELLRLHFADGDVKRRLEGADTKMKKALVWQFFASVLSQSLGMVITHDQVSQKYRKLKCLYRKEKREMRKTGNTVREVEMDEGLWGILNDAFASRVGISGDVLVDTLPDEDEADEADGDDGTDGSPSVERAKPAQAKPQAVAQLAVAMQTGMEAIASSLGARSEADEHLRALTAALQQQYEETHRFQQLQLQLLQQLLAQSSK